MKLRLIIASFAAALMAVACTVEDPISHLEGLEVSNDYITVASDAGSAALITVTGVDAWMAVSSAEWLTVTPFAGTANQTVSVSLTATTAATAARSAEVRIVMGDKVKIILVNQAAPIGTDVPPSKCEDVVNGPDAVYRVSEINLEPGKNSNLGCNGKEYSGQYLMTVGLPVLSADKLKSHVIELNIK